MLHLCDNRVSDNARSRCKPAKTGNEPSFMNTKRRTWAEAEPLCTQNEKTRLNESTL